MFINQYIYYQNKHGDSIPVKIVKEMPKTLEVEGLEKTKRISKANCYYQELEGGFIYLEKLQRLLFTNSKKIPPYFIIGGSLCSWQGIGVVNEKEEADSEDFKKYPQVVQKEFIRWYEWTEKEEND